jgi:hypothetical protein
MGINSTTSAITFTAPVSSPETGFLRHKKWWNSKTKTSIVDVVEVYSDQTFTISPTFGSKSQQAEFFVSLTCIVWNGNCDQHNHPIYLTFFDQQGYVFSASKCWLKVLTNDGVTVDVLELHYQKTAETI